MDSITNNTKDSLIKNEYYSEYSENDYLQKNNLDDSELLPFNNYDNLEPINLDPDFGSDESNI